MFSFPGVCDKGNVWPSFHQAISEFILVVSWNYCRNVVWISAPPGGNCSITNNRCLKQNNNWTIEKSGNDKFVVKLKENCSSSKMKYYYLPLHSSYSFRHRFIFFWAICWWRERLWSLALFDQVIISNLGKVIFVVFWKVYITRNPTITENNFVRRNISFPLIPKSISKFV